MKFLMALPFPFRLLRLSKAARRRLHREDKGIIDPCDAGRLMSEKEIRKWLGS